MNPIQSLYDSNNAYQNIPLSLSLSPSPSLLPELIPFDRQAYATMTQTSLSSGELDNIQNFGSLSGGSSSQVCSFPAHELPNLMTIFFSEFSRSRFSKYL